MVLYLPLKLQQLSQCLPLPLQLELGPALCTAIISYLVTSSMLLNRCGSSNVALSIRIRSILSVNNLSLSSFCDSVSFVFGLTSIAREVGLASTVRAIGE